MKRGTKIGLWAVSAVAVIVLLGWAGGKFLEDGGLIHYMREFTVQVKNNTEHDIIIVEAGLVSGNSKDIINRTLKSGKSFSFKPSLKIEGENGVYMSHTDPGGKLVTTSICGYMETLSGTSKVVIGDVVTVEQNCY
ncbi:hypothetical protein [Paenibacillus paeoniae]|uniref:Uncharacterized protein n=1 Tax=Paenibacillus paeoniae TaxID=2292705 RepID=A0A371P6W9_9BACL|nr:hypothetical protein [Paenibacillus paeoniae]REK71250.1 hypothetical protein DX130_22670 [Paenibacillus paeoniae]